MIDYQGIRNGDLQDLVSRLRDEQLRKRDIVLPAEFMSMQDGQVIINDLPDGMFKEDEIQKMIKEFGVTGDFEIQFNALQQAEYNMSQKLSIPVTYYRYLKQNHVDMLDYNISELFKRHGKPLFVRTFAPTDSDGVGLLRAVLSDRYKVIDHLDILSTTLSAIKDKGADVEIGRCNLTENNMYIEFMSKQVKMDAPEAIRNYQSPDGGKGGGVVAGFVVSNSETGAGMYKIAPRVVVMACKNGLIRTKDAMQNTHLGKTMDAGIRWSKETKSREVDLIMSQVKDAVDTFLSDDYLGHFLNDLVQDNEKLRYPTEAVKNVSSELSIPEEEQREILNYFIESGDFTPLGVTQAITYHAHEHSSAERQYELESKAVDILPNIRNFDPQPNQLN